MVYNQKTLAELFRVSVASYADSPFISFVDEPPLTYRQFAELVTSITSLLHAYKLNPGDRIAILSENTPNWGAIFLAAATSGLTAVPILPDFPQSDVRHIIRHSEAKLVFISPRQQTKLEDFEDPMIQDIILMDGFQSIIKNKTSNLLELHRHLPNTPFKTPDEDDLASLIYTSGTTGHSKGVMLTHLNLFSDVINSVKGFPMNQQDSFLSILPLAHTYECTSGFMVPLYIGSSVTYIRGLPTPKTLLAAMSSVKPRALLTVPLVMEKIYRNQVQSRFNSKAVTRLMYKNPLLRKLLHKIAGKKLYKAFGNNLRFIMFGGAALNADVEQFLIDAHFPYSIGYGLTETSPIVSINPLHHVKPNSIGKPIPEVQVRIFQPDAQGVGEIIVKGPIVMKGYYNNPQANETVFLPDNWLRTGDLGTIDQDGYVFIKGRLKNVIIGPSGENIYPEIIEQLLCSSSFVQQAIVYKQNNKLMAKIYPDYEAIDAHIQDNPQQPVNIPDLLEKIRLQINTQLSSFCQISKIFEQREPFDLTPTKKVKRYLYLNNNE
ncbi:MAG: AMP-binding protein [Candidatus Delongbacteria bacterium]|nr:AMP-binding protein [Candidatus Delongbacteria bacterium]